MAKNINLSGDALPVAGSKLLAADPLGNVGYVDGSVIAYAGEPELEEVLGIGTMGGPGAGVAYTPDLPDGMYHLSGNANRLSETYGNYQYSDGSIAVYIPAFYYKYGTGSNGLTVNQVDVKPFSYFATVSAANADGYALHRAFYNGGSIRPGFFIDKYINSANDGVASSLKNGIPLSSAVRGALVGADFAAALSVTNNLAGAVDGAKLRGTGWHCMTIFQRAALALLALAHGQAATSATYCAWYDSAGVKNFPKGCNNNAYGDVNDADIAYEPDGNGTYNCPLTGSANLPARVSHNGQACGVMDLNGTVWEIAPGVSADATNFYLLDLAANVAELGSGNTLDTDYWGAVSFAANYINLGATYGPLDNSATNKVMGSVSQVLSEAVSGTPWATAGAGVPLVGGVGGSNAFGNDYFYTNNPADMCPQVGGTWTYTTIAGVWALTLSSARTYSSLLTGFRSALYL